MTKQPFANATIFMGSVTTVGNRPFRRLVTEYGAEATLGEMAIAKYVAQKKKQELALIRRDPHEKIFGAQIVGGNPEHLSKAARMAEEFGADFIDFNCACPHQSVVSHGGGAILLRRPQNLPMALDAIRQAVSIPVSIKIRKGFEEGDNVAQQVAELAQNAGFNAIFIHGRTKAAQYRGPCDWETIESVARNIDIPVIGCGDLAHGSDVIEKRKSSACSGFAIARGALIKPWIFEEIATGQPLDPTAEQRLDMLKKLVSYSLETFGSDDFGVRRSRDFLLRQMGFLCRYVPTGALGRELPLQERVGEWTPRNELESLWASADKNDHLQLLEMAGLPKTEAEDPLPACGA